MKIINEILGEGILNTVDLANAYKNTCSYCLLLCLLFS